MKLKNILCLATLGGFLIVLAVIYVPNYMGISTTDVENVINALLMYYLVLLQSGMPTTRTNK